MNQTTLAQDYLQALGSGEGLLDVIRASRALAHDDQDSYPEITGEGVLALFFLAEDHKREEDQLVPLWGCVYMDGSSLVLGALGENAAGYALPVGACHEDVRRLVKDTNRLIRKAGDPAKLLTKQLKKRRTQS